MAPALALPLGARLDYGIVFWSVCDEQKPAVQVHHAFAWMADTVVTRSTGYYRGPVKLRLKSRQASRVKITPEERIGMRGVRHLQSSWPEISIRQARTIMQRYPARSNAPIRTIAQRQCVRLPIPVPISISIQPSATSTAGRCSTSLRFSHQTHAALWRQVACRGCTGHGGASCWSSPRSRR